MLEGTVPDIRTPPEGRNDDIWGNDTTQTREITVKCADMTKRAARERQDAGLKPSATLKPFERKNIRLAAKSYRGRRMYFLTLCFEGRRAFGANARVASWLIDRLKEQAAASGFFVHAYCVMPDHMHVLVCASANDSDLMAFVEAYKRDTGFAFQRRVKRRLWQFKYYDRVLRGSDSPESVAWYIWLNPVRKGMCRTPTEYPFLGSFTKIGALMLKGSMAAEWRPPRTGKV